MNQYLKIAIKYAGLILNALPTKIPKKMPQHNRTDAEKISSYSQKASVLFKSATGKTNDKGQ